MGYDTSYKGTLRFKNELLASQIAYLRKYLDEDMRDHKDWKLEGYHAELTYIDLELTDDFSGLQYTGAEKSYDMIEKINFIIQEMQNKYGSFGLEGQLWCQGEDIDDCYKIIIQDNQAIRIDNKPEGQKIECPYCQKEFYYKGA